LGGALALTLGLLAHRRRAVRRPLLAVAAMVAGGAGLLLALVQLTAALGAALSAGSG